MKIISGPVTGQLMHNAGLSPKPYLKQLRYKTGLGMIPEEQRGWRRTAGKALVSMGGARHWKFTSDAFEHDISFSTTLKMKTD